MTDIKPIETDNSPKDILISKGFDLPISGGWGYTKQDACIIETVKNFGVSTEYKFVELRIYEEILSANNEEDVIDIKWKLNVQSLIENDGKYYDRLVFDVTLTLVNEVLTYPREFWFDITSFH